MEVTETVENGIRRIDAVMSDGTKYELKYVTKLDKSAIDKMIIQFERDVDLVGREGIGRLNWVFRGAEVNLAGIGTLRQKMQKILERQGMNSAEAERQVERIVQFWSEKGMPFD